MFKKKSPAGIQATEDRTQEGSAEKTPQVHFFTKFIFWLSLVSFLANSIQHVAWVYHVYEGNTPQPINLWLVQFDLKWLIPYGTAVGIDVLTSWLAFIQTLGKSKSEGSITWGFIFALCGLSWYCNYLYSMMNDPIKQADMWNINILFGLTTTGYITPIIVSAVPVFVIAYTFMLSKMGTSAVTASDLDKQITELQDLNAKKQALASLKGQAFVSSITGVVHTAKASLQAIQTQTEVSQSEPHVEEPGIPAEAPADHPVVTWTQDNKVASVQFPGKEPVVHDHSQDTPADGIVMDEPYWTTDPIANNNVFAQSSPLPERNTGELETPAAIPVTSDQATAPLRVAPRIKKKAPVQA